MRWIKHDPPSYGQAFFEGAPIFYSWPPQENLRSYVVDESTIAWSQTYVEQFLEDLLAKSDAQNIYRIAHSMGSRALAGALTARAERVPGARERFREIILTAPDIDAGVFSAISRRFS